ncbi:MAG: signal recognition particle protein [Actinobacteria bacterium]|nr:signal recognition particle protein [Actinomycetota bacterium]
MFESLSAKFQGAFASLRSKGRLKSGDIDEISLEIRSALLDSDVSLSVVDNFITELKVRTDAILEDLNKSTNPANAVFEIVNSLLIEILGGSARRIRLAKKPPTVILLTGLQGAGKTSLAGKLAKYLKDQGNTPLLVASDLQRPNAVTQLQVVGESIGVPVFAPEPGNGVGDPITVAKSGLQFAQDKLHNIVIVDTAGRLGVDAELMKQAKSIRDAVNPDEVLYVVDAMVGQDAVRTAQAFQEGVGFDAIVLTKLDGDARGGAALSITQVTGKPIMFAATGEKVTDFDLFYPDRMASRILGLGDIATLAEQAKGAFDSDTASKLESKFASGEDFTLDDFLSQLEAMKKMGSMTKLLGMLPGANSGAMKKQLEQFDEGELVKTQSIVQSMTPLERNDPKVLNGSRRSRIAKGSGRQVSDVNSLVERFTQAQKVMKQMRTGKGGAQLPPGMALPPGMPQVPAPKVINKKKSRSGNPAKRALES